MDDLDQLYQDIILDHYRHPRNRETLADEDVSVEEDNPLCGDRVRVAVELDGDRIRSICHDGKGCAVSLASASIMAASLEGLLVCEALELADQVIGALKGERDFPENGAADILALRGVKKYPLRVKCATLAWHGICKALAK